MSVKPIPDGYHSVTPYLIVKGGGAAIDFYKRAFNAVEVMRLEAPDGKLGHAEISIGNSRVMLADEFPEMGAVSPQTLAGTAVSLLIYVEDCDALFQQAVAAGAIVERPLANQFYGDRSGMLADPFGHRWCIASRQEELTVEEINARAMKQMAPS